MKMVRFFVKFIKKKNDEIYLFGGRCKSPLQIPFFVIDKIKY